MTKYEVRVNVFYDDLNKADDLFKYLEGIKSDFVKFDDPNYVYQVSKVELIENHHDEIVKSPCVVLKSLTQVEKSDEFVKEDNIL